MPGLWMNDESFKGGKYLVLRRDGTQPEWPYFVLGAKDPAAPEALRRYASKAEEIGMDPQYVEDVRDLADRFEVFRATHGEGDPTAPRHRKDDPEIVNMMGPFGA